MSRPRLLDLFCCAGGAGMGYHRAGFDVVGVDIRPQPDYPFVFVQADAIEFVRGAGAGFDAIHASPPCQRYSELTPATARASHPDLIAPTQQALRVAGVPYVIENVDGARHLLGPSLMLCGTMFGLPVWRHRWFEMPWWKSAVAPTECRHRGRPVVVSGRKRGCKDATPDEMRAALGTPWIRRRSDVREAIPPAYTEYIGKPLVRPHRRQRGARRMTLCTELNHEYDGSGLTSSGKYELCRCGGMYRRVTNPPAPLPQQQTHDPITPNSARRGSEKPEGTPRG